MHRTEGANNLNNEFVDGPPGTTVGADILNAFQEELCIFPFHRNLFESCSAGLL